MSKKKNDLDDYTTINIGDIDLSVPFGDPFTVTTMADGAYTIADSSYTYFQDQTPSDPVEEAELKLQGICPACRNELPTHEWSCPHRSWSLDGVTLTSDFDFVNTTPSVQIGTAVLTEEKLEKLDKILDAFGDVDIDDLIKKLDKLKDL